jgi:hypothetical protein
MNNKEAIAKIYNEKLSGFLQESRTRTCRSLSLISESVGLPESRILEIEERPAQVPLCELARVISFYGPERIEEAQLLMIDAGVEVNKRNLIRTKRDPLVRVRRQSLLRSVAKVAAFVAGFALWDLLKHTFRTLIGGRLG